MICSTKPFCLIMNLAFLHTADVHIDTFDALLKEGGNTHAVSHAVRADLLERARQDGVDSVKDDVAQAVDRLIASSGADLVVCTCSTIGDVAEKLERDMPIWRVDRPMMETAVSSGQHILLACTLESTLEPSRALLTSVVSDQISTQITDWFCQDAWAYFAKGDLAGYAQSVADSLAKAPQADVIVLAQASMASAIPLCADISIPILDSPTTAVSAIMNFLN